ncbi:GTP binding protein [Chrysochromulina tobinii]|uniref:GTP binding protein n=1 Tax=Chrysochromulina tobinii TaxID=1460289 RepID=A0A0M0K2R6_9EUKA|nr:GTP binding protein [Chrysochromulina tobinii]|eukprot:KOO32887.1 GTP binding protein [Chrysochromulina sp. CCMP291]
MLRILSFKLVRRRAFGRRLCWSAAEIEDAAMRAPRSLSAAEIEDAAMRAPRRRGERVDSVDSVTLADRVFHLERMSKADIDPKILAEVRALRLGRIRHGADQKRADQRRITIAQQHMGNTVLLGKTSVGMHHEWDRLNRESLPEVVLLGHSNCGKSALLNALAGTHARHGPAHVSPRAGWTADLGFYRMRTKVPITALGPSAPARPYAASGEGEGESAGAVVGAGEGAPLSSYAEDARHDARPLSSYAEDARHDARQRERMRGALGMILVDTPGYGFAVLPVLTKADLLLPEDLAASHAVVSAQLAEAAPAGTGVRAPPPMLSAHFLTGVANLWRVLLRTLAEIERAEFGAQEGRRRREGLEGAHSVEDEDESDVGKWGRRGEHSVDEDESDVGKWGRRGEHSVDEDESDVARPPHGAAEMHAR